MKPIKFWDLVFFIVACLFTAMVYRETGPFTAGAIAYTLLVLIILGIRQRLVKARLSEAVHGALKKIYKEHIEGMRRHYQAQIRVEDKLAKNCGGHRG